MRDFSIDMVLVKAISRFARNTVTMLEIVRELKGLGIDVYFEKENIYLNTFACLRRALKKPALFADAVCLEFFGEQNSQVALLVEQDHTVQIYPMRQVYPGIFCKDLTLFYDDVVSYQYRITENGEEKLTEKQTLSRTGQGQSFDESRYGLINRMLELESQFHNDELVYTMGRFIKNERFIAENFSIE